MRPLRSIAVLPTMVTLGNLVCGFFAIVIASRVDKPDALPVVADMVDLYNVMIAGWLILLGMVFDSMDGQVARLSNTTSEFGVQLDSLCDLVTFGVAPGFILVKMCPRFTYGHGQMVWVIAVLFVICVALRLARFNVETSEDDDHMAFSGLPSPAGAAAIASFAIIFHKLNSLDNHGPWIDSLYMAMQMILPFCAVAIAILMVSRIPYPHWANQLLKGQRSLLRVVMLVFFVGFLVVARSFSIPLMFCIFVLYGPTTYGWKLLSKWRNACTA